MAFFDFIHAVFTGMFVGYMSLTTMLADRIENVFFHIPHESIAIQTQNISAPVSESILQLTSMFTGTIPHVLLEHAEYQKAALSASQKDELPTTLATNIPLKDAAERALVNVFCQYKTDRYIRTTTGTGFFINPKGVIITNAHVAQFLLLENVKHASGTVDCVIRSGNPAKAVYKAELLYISPTWVVENKKVIAEESPQGTGERDYALLYVTKTLDDSPLPTQFPAIPISTTLLPRSTAGTSVTVAGYPAEAFLRGGADTQLLPITAQTKVGTLYTFGSNYADIFSINESPVGEQGASGGPIISDTGRSAIGLIVTKGDMETEGAHSLRALTLSYVDRTIIEETGFSLAQNMQGNLSERGSVFKKAMVPFLAGILEETLQTQ